MLRHALGGTRVSRLRNHVLSPSCSTFISRQGAIRPITTGASVGSQGVKPVDFGVEGKVVLVTAASDGLGKATAKVFAEAGAQP